MSAHRLLWAGLHPSGVCDDCDDERDQREADEQADAHDEAPSDGHPE